MSRLISGIVVAVSAAAFGLGAFASEALEPRTSNLGGVTVKVTPRNVTGSVWRFEVVMDTHTEPLNDDLGRSAVLVTADGQVAPTSWTGDGPGSHHRKGVLSFKSPASQSGTITIHLARPGEARARSFEWERK